MTTETGIVGYKTTWSVSPLGNSTKAHISSPITFFDMKNEAGDAVVVTLEGDDYLDIYNQILSTFKFINKPTVTPTTHAVDTSKWNTYVSKQYGFEFKYPVMFKINPEMTDADVDNTLTVNVYPDIKSYKFEDPPGGLIARFDINKKQWIGVYIDAPSEFLPKRTTSSIESYAYKTGDVNCSSEVLLIPGKAYSFMINITNIVCRDLDGSFFPGHYALTGDQILSTFKYI